MWNGADGMQIGIGVGPRVVLRNARAELDVGAHRLPEWRVVGQAASSSASM